MSDIDGNYLKAYTLNQSHQKVVQVQDILSRKIGDNWKNVLFMMLVLVACIISIIIFGINIDNSPYKISLSHIKVFFIILVISISFFIVWAIIKPNAVIKQTGIVPFPPGDTLVPVDSSQCGIIPTLCTLTSDCVSKCGSQNYSCHVVEHPNTYYLGSKLEVNKSYCLPKIEQLKDIKGCGTYTGRIVWTKSPDGTLGWQCQCLYPDLFSGSDCTKQIGCQYTDNNGQISTSDLKDKDGNIWWSDKTGYDSPPPSNTTPYDTNNDGTPIYKCSCPSGLYSTDLDPFSCNQDLCYGGYGTSNVAHFDLSTNQCVCKERDENNNIMYKSNISGFCYPIEATEKTCNLNTKGDGCKYGIELFYRGNPVMFKKDKKYYMSKLSDDVENLIDISNIVKSNGLDESKFYDISNTVLKDAFYSFPIKDSKDSGSPNITSDVINIYNNDWDKMQDRLENLVRFAVPKGGVAQKCNSYYYRRDGYPNCDDLLSKTGTQAIVTTLDCGSYKDKDKKDIAFDAVIDLDNIPYGYHCDCKLNGRKDPGCSTISDGWHTVTTFYDSSETDTYKVNGKYIDRIKCNDKVGEAPQKCIGGCIADGGESENIEQCCIYESDSKDIGIKNSRYENDWELHKIQDPKGLAHPNAKKKCPNRERRSCNSGDDCSHACAKVKDNGKKVCCPSGGNYLVSDYWCDYLDKGEKCKWGNQCNSGKCSNSVCE